MPIDPRILCCASGTCCEPGSPEQLSALAAVEKDFTAAGLDLPKVARDLAKMTAKHGRP